MCKWISFRTIYPHQEFHINYLKKIWPSLNAVPILNAFCSKFISNTCRSHHTSLDNNDQISKLLTYHIHILNIYSINKFMPLKNCNNFVAQKLLPINQCKSSDHLNQDFWLPCLFDNCRWWLQWKYHSPGIPQDKMHILSRILSMILVSIILNSAYMVRNEFCT